ncbi:hypothetical protein [Metabacillus litoralis]|uniref:hypothetical protein n=1 Tax=Metabacillus litoralis TaxID=152268 RepID=UPI001CFCF57A|nr:hypothetical protein [Metabacillus litoralis]
MGVKLLLATIILIITVDYSLQIINSEANIYHFILTPILLIAFISIVYHALKIKK